MVSRRKFTTAVVSSASIALLTGCLNPNNDDDESGDGDVEGAGPRSQQSTEDTEDQTERVFEQFRKEKTETDVDGMNQYIYDDGDFPLRTKEGKPGINGDTYTVRDLELNVYETKIDELTLAEYERKENVKITVPEMEQKLSETGGTDYALISWYERYEIIDADPQFENPDEVLGYERTFNRYYMLHKIDGEWLIVNRLFPDGNPTENE